MIFKFYSILNILYSEKSYRILLLIKNIIDKLILCQYFKKY